MANVQTHIDTIGFRGPWTLDTTSALPINGLTVIAAPGGGRYIRQGPVPGFNQTTDVYVNTSTGSDDNAGTIGSPLATPVEAGLRLGQQPIDGAVNNLTIHLSGNYAGAFPLSPSLVNLGSIIIAGARAILDKPGRTYTLAVLTPPNGATQTPGLYQLTDDLGGHPDLNGFGWSQGRARLQVTGSTNIIGEFGKTINNALATFNAVWTNTNTFSTVTPPAGTVNVYTTNEIQGTVVVNGDSAQGVIVFQDVKVSSVAHGTVVNAPFVQFIGADVYGIVINRPVNECDLVAAQMLTFFQSFGACVIIGCYSFQVTIQWYAFNLGNVQGDFTIEQANLVIGNTSWGNGYMALLFGASLCIIDYTAAGTALEVINGTFNAAAGYLFAINSAGTPANGFRIRAGQQLIYGAGFLPVVTVANPPTKPWNIGGTSMTQAAVAAAVTVNAANAALVALDS